MQAMGKPAVSLLLVLWLFFLVFSSSFMGCFSAANGFRSSVVFPVSGNVYPLGYYHVALNIGNPPKTYFLDIDSGSDLTWLQCDAPCVKCTPAPHPPYKPKNNLITCKDPLCDSLHQSESINCEDPDDQCDYELEYADQGSSLGVLIRDSFMLRLTNGSVLGPNLAFGCGYNQEFPDSSPPPYVDGVFGLGNGKSSILVQMRLLGLTRSVVGHCLAAQGEGFLFFGDDLVPSSGVVWAPMSDKSVGSHYSLGPAELLVGGQSTGIKDLTILFDSGSTYSYFNFEAYNACLSLIKKNLHKDLKDADKEEDSSLPVCWKAAKHYNSVHDVKTNFKPLALRLSKTKNIQFQLLPEAYLIVSGKGNVCLGIMNGTEVGLEDFIVIGDISLQDQIVIYDNEKQQIGWSPSNCNRLPNMDRNYDEDSSLPYAANFGIL